MNKSVTMYRATTVNNFAVLALLVATLCGIYIGVNFKAIEQQVVMGVSSARDTVAFSLMTKEATAKIAAIEIENGKLKAVNYSLERANLALSAQASELAKVGYTRGAQYRNCEVARQNALIPETTVSQAVQHHVVEPAKEVVVTTGNTLRSVWDKYEFQPERLTSWVKSVF